MLIPGLITVWLVAIAWYAFSTRTSGVQAEHSIGSFQKQLHSLRRSDGLLIAPANRLSFPGERMPSRVSGAAFRHSEISRRRRSVLMGLAAVASLVGMLALVTGSGLLFGLFCLSATAFLGYVWALAQLRAAQQQKRLSGVNADVYAIEDRRSYRAA